MIQTLGKPSDGIGAQASAPDRQSTKPSRGPKG